jgi:hypothetical protein
MVRRIFAQEPCTRVCVVRHRICDLVGRCEADTPRNVGQGKSEHGNQWTSSQASRHPRSIPCLGTATRLSSE